MIRRERPITEIYRKWRQKNRLSNAFNISTTAIFVTAVMILFDYLFLDFPVNFTEIRLAVTLAILPNLVLIKHFTSDDRNYRNWMGSLSILWPIGIFNISYILFVYFLDHNQFDVYYTGLLITIFFSSFMLHVFWKEQYFYNICFASAAVALTYATPTERHDSLYIVVIVHLAAGFVSRYFRYQFVSSLYGRFMLLKTMLPEKVAAYVVVSNETLRGDTQFSPKIRFSVCLCADWRNFQQLAQVKSPEDLSLMLEKYFDIVLENLRTLLPGRNYYFDWTADELFIVFFNDNSSEEAVMAEALHFATEMCGSIYQEVHRAFDGKVMYDVGLSAGPGLFGLQGPKEMKKAVLHGEVAGRAKRLEQEAKRLRHIESSRYPRLVMEMRLNRFAQSLPIGGDGTFREIEAVTNDIKGERVVIWEPSPPSDLKRAV